MSLNKNAAYRYRLIDICLRSKPWTISDLIDYISHKLYEEFDIETGISERQILDDIALMRKPPPQGYSAPIVRHLGVLSYSDKSFTIHNLPLIVQDLKSLEEALSLLKQFSNLPHFYELKNVYDKLNGAITHVKTEQQFSGIELERNEEVKGLEFISILYSYIQKEQALEIAYKPFQEEAVLRMPVHPYLLKEYNNRWFLIAWSDDMKTIINLGLDRIIEINLLQKPYENHAREAAYSYHKQIVGVTLPRNKVAEVIQIKVSAQRTPYFLTKPIHSSQKKIAETEEGSCIFEFFLIPNFEWKAFLLGHGSGVKVLSPEHLRLDIIAELKKSLGSYSS